MKTQYSALSIVAPNGSKILNGEKTIEVRSWQPSDIPLRDVVIVENQNFLRDQQQEMGKALAIVDFVSVVAWTPDQFDAACATQWVDGYFAWKIENVRAIKPQSVFAKRKIYFVEINHK